jgi:hypothetical protein
LAKACGRVWLKGVTAPALELLQAGTNEDGTTIPLTTDQKALNIRIRLNNNAAAERFRSACEKAAGDIYIHLSQSQRAHVRGIEDDPIAMWDKLSSIHSQQVPGMRFGAYNELLSVTKQPDKSLQSVAGRVSEALVRVQELRPESFTIVQLNKELAIMAMLCALPRDVYGDFVSSLMCEKTLMHTDVESAFQIEQIERNTQDGPLVGSAALRTFGKPSSLHSNSDECPFCTIKGHAQEDCYKYKSARNNTIKLVKERKVDTRGGGNKRKGKANCAKAKEEEVVEKAQRAQVRLAASPSSSADTHWIADTGATSHMTPHRSWFTSYCPHIVPIRVANDAIVYSASVGDVVLTPTNAALRPCRLSRVLHVPDLQNNLFAVLHLTSHHQFRVVIEGLQLQFSQQGALCLTATVKDGMAYMDVKVAAVAEAVLASRAPLTRSLWHRRLVHIGEAKIEQAQKHALAQGLKVDSNDPIPHICVPCVHGKQHCDPFPAKASH